MHTELAQTAAEAALSTGAALRTSTASVKSAPTSVARSIKLSDKSAPRKLAPGATALMKYAPGGITSGGLGGRNGLGGGL